MCYSITDQIWVSSVYQTKTTGQLCPVFEMLWCCFNTHNVKKQLKPNGTLLCFSEIIPCARETHTHTPHPV